MPDMHIKRNIVKEETTEMMDHERQERDLQKIFDATQTSYLAAVENTFALQERILEFARNVMESSAETLKSQAENNRATLETLTQQSQKHRKAMENLVRESQRYTRAYFAAPSTITNPTPSSRKPRSRPRSSPQSSQTTLFSRTPAWRSSQNSPSPTLGE